MPDLAYVLLIGTFLLLALMIRGLERLWTVENVVGGVLALLLLLLGYLIVALLRPERF